MATSPSFPTQSVEASLARLQQNTLTTGEALAKLEKSMRDLEDAFLDGRIKGHQIAMTQGRYPRNWFRPELMIE